MKYRGPTNVPSHIAREECYFYHTMDLDEHGVIEGDWDLRGSEDLYLGPTELSGKTVFDVGPATGFLSFEMARRGANVVALEWDETAQSDFGLIPNSDFEGRFQGSYADKIEERRRNIIALKNSFLFSQRALGMEIPIYVGDAVRSAPPMEVDIALLGCILLHLRDPVGALYNIVTRVRETVIVTDLSCGVSDQLDGTPSLLFFPSAQTPSNIGTWWYASPAALKEILGDAGFNRFELSAGTIFCNETKSRADIFNLTASRS